MGQKKEQEEKEHKNTKKMIILALLFSIIFIMVICLFTCFFILKNNSNINSNNELQKHEENNNLDNLFEKQPQLSFPNIPNEKKQEEQIQPFYKPELDDIEKIQLAMLMNQIQYDTSIIMRTRDRELLSQKFDFIINHIRQSKLYDNIMLKTYLTQLNTIIKLQLNDNERSFVIEMSEQKRKHSYLNAFSNYGSIFNPGFNTKGLIASMIYTGISAGLNIASAKMEIDNNLKEQLFRIKQSDFETLQEHQKELFNSSTLIINNYGIPEDYKIINSKMDDFIIQLSANEGEPERLIPILEDKKEVFKEFPIFWLQLGSLYQDKRINKISEAVDCYDKFEKLTDTYSYIKYNPYYTVFAKNKIIILKNELGKNNITSAESLEIKKQIEYYLKRIKENSLDTESENRIFMACIYYDIFGNYNEAKRLLNLNILRGEDYYTSNKLLSLIEFDNRKNTIDQNSLMALGFEEILLKVNKKDKKFSIFIPFKLSTDSFVYLVVGGKKIYPNLIPSNKPIGENEYNCEIIFNNVDLDLDKVTSNKNFELVIGIANNSGTMELLYNCDYLVKNTKIEALLKVFNRPIEQIEPCLLPDIFNAVDNFTYKPEEDKNYTVYVDSLKENFQDKNTIKRYSIEKAEELKKEKLDTLISNIYLKSESSDNKLLSKPFFCSAKSFSGINESFVYSLKKVTTDKKVYVCEKYQTPKESNEKPSFITKDINNLKELVLKAINNNKNAQYDLAQVYDEPFGDTAKKYINAFIYYPGLSGFKDYSIFTVENLWGEELKERNLIKYYWYEKAANNGHGHASYIYADRLLNGDYGFEKNLKKAKEYALNAIENGYDTAKSHKLLVKIENKLN